MKSIAFRLFAAAGLLLAATSVFAAAASVQRVTPLRSSVAGGETQVFAARFFDAAGRPAVGERVTFTNDVCGTFPNGEYGIEVLTDATGLAQTTFRADNPPGITCWIMAHAGAWIRFNVLTFSVDGVRLELQQFPPQPRPGEPFTVRVSPKYGVYPVNDVDVAARVIASGASAALNAASINSGQEGYVDFLVTPDKRVGDYELVFDYRGRVGRLPMRAGASPLQDMWWAGSVENGWGMSVVQHGEQVFSVIYAYDALGKPTWYVMPGGEWNAAHTEFSGALYLPRGAPWTAYDASRFMPGTPVGRATLRVIDVTSIALEYEIGGVSGTRLVTRHQFGAAESVAALPVGDMWWGGAAQDGWGLAMLQQYRAIFALWFTYDAEGAPTWFVMPSGFWSDAQTWQGRIYRASGSRWLGAAYDPAAFRTTEAGTFRMRFDAVGVGTAGATAPGATTATATFDYTIDGHGGTIAVSRLPF
jgi:hypothetical protein